MNTTELLTFPVPLNARMHQIAEDLSQQQSSPARQKQVYLDTLAVLTVDFYCQCMQIETDLDNSDCFNSITRHLMDVADLKLKNIGQIECRAIAPGDNYCYIPAEVWDDRIGYIVVMIDEDENKATVLGFVEKVETEQLPLSQLRSLSDFLVKVEEIQLAHSTATAPVKTPPVINLGEWVLLLKKHLQEMKANRTVEDIASSLTQEIKDLGQDIWNLVLFENRAIYPRTALAKSSAIPQGSNNAIGITGFERNLIIAGQTYLLQIKPRQEKEEVIWRFKLTNSQPDGFIPGGFKLRLLTEDGQAFDGNEDFAEKAEKELYVDVILEPGERIIWETEPMAEDYQTEVLSF